MKRQAGQETMGSQHEQRGNRKSPWWIAALVAGGAAVVAIAIATGALRLGTTEKSSPSAEQAAQQRCEAEVIKRLVSPEKATVSEVRTETSELDPDARDFSPLNTSESLKGIDVSHITVLNVSGVANAPSEVGSTIRDHFDCRAYFVDNRLVDTLVVFDHGH